MTTIAFKDGILAADTQETFEGDTKGYCHKITILPNNIVVSCAGDSLREWWFLKWLGGEKIPKANSNFKGLQSIFIEEGKVYWTNGGIEKIPLYDKIYAIGSGGKVARAAMCYGLSAKEAVKFAAEVDIYTSKRVDCYDKKLQKLTYGK